MTDKYVLAHWSMWGSGWMLVGVNGEPELFTKDEAIDRATKMVRHNGVNKVKVFKAVNLEVVTTVAIDEGTTGEAQ